RPCGAVWIRHDIALEERGRSHAVVHDLRAQLGVAAAVAMAHDRAGLVDERLAVVEHAEEHLEVSRAGGHGPHVQRRIEASETRKEAPPERHVRPRPELSEAAVPSGRPLPPPPPAPIPPAPPPAARPRRTPRRATAPRSRARTARPAP